jgi:hypothetical protein
MSSTWADLEDTWLFVGPTWASIIALPAWSPNVTVQIGGRDYTGATLETVRITRGRNEIYEEPRAGYAICELIDLNGTGLGIQPLERMTVSIQDSYGNQLRVFTGNVSDTSAVLYDNGVESGTAGAITTVIAVAPLARLNRRIVATDGLPEQNDGDRIAELIAEGLGARWEETGGTWQNAYDPDVTWQDVDSGLDLTFIDQPGDFTVAALPAEAAGYQPLTQAYITAISGRGVIFDRPDGFIAYQDASHRRNEAETNGYRQLPNTSLLANRLTVTSTQTDITNRTIVEFEGGTVIFTDEDSVIDYGLQAKRFQTNLVNSAQAEAWALDYLEDHRRPNLKLSGVAARLDQDDLATRETLLSYDVGSPLLLSGLPVTLGVQTFPAFVEGVDWRLNRDTVEIILNVSDAALSIGSVQWNQVDPTLEWGDVSATLQWIDAVEVTV